MIDNFEIIKSLLSFPSEDIFYFCQILKRKKEHPELGNNSVVVKTYFVKSIEDLNRYRDEMITLARFHNARVYISLNQRSFEKSAFQMLKKVTDQILNKDYKNVRKAYNSVCGMYTEGDKFWIIDVDTPSTVGINEIKSALFNVQPLDVKKFITTIPTKNGYHVITKPFNVEQFKLLISGLSIHKNNPTILYCL